LQLQRYTSSFFDKAYFTHAQLRSTLDEFVAKPEVQTLQFICCSGNDVKTVLFLGLEIINWNLGES